MRSFKMTVFPLSGTGLSDDDVVAELGTGHIGAYREVLLCCKVSKLDNLLLQAGIRMGEKVLIYYDRTVLSGYLR